MNFDVYFAKRYVYFDVSSITIIESGYLLLSRCAIRDSLKHTSRLWDMMKKLNQISDTIAELSARHLPVIDSIDLKSGYQKPTDCKLNILGISTTITPPAQLMVRSSTS